MGLPSRARQWRGFRHSRIFDKIGSSEVVKTLLSNGPQPGKVLIEEPFVFCRLALRFRFKDLHLFLLGIRPLTHPNLELERDCSEKSLSH